MGTSKSFETQWKKLTAKIKGLPAGAPNPQALKKSLHKIKTGIEASIKTAEKEGLEGALPALKNFEEEVQLDLDNVHALIEQAKHLEKLENEFNNHRKKFRELEAKTTEACGKYFDRRQEYVRALKKEEDRVSRELSNYRTEFMDKAESIIQGYELIVDDVKCSAEKLYEGLIEENLGRVYLTPKSRGKALLGVLGEEDKSKAKEEVLRYLINETARKITPTLRDKQESLELVKRAFLDLKGLENECKEAEELRSKAEKEIEAMRVEILGIRMSKSYAYSKKEKLQELNERYSRNIIEIDEALN